MNTIDLLSQAQLAAAGLAPHLPRPSIFPVVRDTYPSLPSIQRFDASGPQPLKALPFAAVQALLPIARRDIQPSWQDAFVEYEKAADALEALHHELGRSGFTGAYPFGPKLGSVDAAGAGVLLLLQTHPRFRGALFELALRRPIGAFLAAHVPDRRDDETENVMKALWWEPELLYWWARDLPKSRDACCLIGAEASGIHGALLSAQTIDRDWPDRLVRRASKSPNAASAALVLFPESPWYWMERWVATVLPQPRMAYETVRWAKHTWPEKGWLALRDRLRPFATVDRGRFWYHWYRDVEPEAEPSGFGDGDLLWCIELLLHRGAPALRLKLEGQLVEILSANPYDRESMLLLEWCSRGG